MAIEKMALVQIEGALRKVNKTLVKCCESNCFHIIATNHSTAEYDSDKHGFKTLKTKNPYTPVLNRAKALANGMGVEIVHADYDDVAQNVSVDFANYISGIEERYNLLNDAKNEIVDSLKNHSTALVQVEQIAGLDVDFKDIYACKYVKSRFGKLPLDSVPKLSYYEDKSFVMYRFQTSQQYVWILYLVPESCSVEVDEIFSSLYFERVRLPDYFTGTADDAKTAVMKLVKEENEKLADVEKQIKELADAEKDYFLKAVNKLTAIEQSYDLRQNVLAINNKFYMSGYVPKRKLATFTDMLENLGGVDVQEKPLDSELNSNPPVLLRNNWLFRPFEMFVKMYGLPNYSAFDPTPYVAVTYMLIFGIMFGDLGQGLLITLFGFLLNRWKHAKLAPVMERIGITSAIFGTLYGSVFGNEEIIKPFFKYPNIYRALGYVSEPSDIFRISTILLLSAIAIGVVLVLISMGMNIVTCLRNRKFADAIISPNGVTGVIFYASLMVGAALQLGLGITVFTAPYVWCLILLPLILLFLKEPICEFAGKLFRGRGGDKNFAFIHSIKTYSDAVSSFEAVAGGESDIDELAECGYVRSQFGLLPIKSYAQLEKTENTDFLFYPFETDGEYVQGVYLSTAPNFPIVERIFEGFGFKKMKMPEHIADIHKESSFNIDRYVERGEKAKKKSVGTFIIEGVIELFESCLTYITNTMSFLRIGGFILSHAGMMLVFSVLAAKFGSGAIVVQIIGNIFVIGMEGFLVGIQVLRLEFYEIFSRFYKADGKPFKPVTVDLNLE